MEPMNPDSEAIYDTYIAPLMSHIIDMCKQHRIPMLATFQYCDDSHPDGPGMCTTRIPFDGESRQFAVALKAMQGDPLLMTFVTIAERGAA